MIGYFRTYVGLLKYTDDTQWYDPPWVVAAVAAGAFIFLLLVLVPLCVYCCCNGRKKDVDSPTREPVDLGYLTMSTVVTRSPASWAGAQVPSPDDGYIQPVSGGDAAYLEPVGGQLNIGASEAYGQTPYPPNYIEVLGHA